MNCPFCHKPVDTSRHERGVIYHMSCILKATKDAAERLRKSDEHTKKLQERKRHESSINL